MLLQPIGEGVAVPRNIVFVTTIAVAYLGPLTIMMFVDLASNDRNDTDALRLQLFEQPHDHVMSSGPRAPPQSAPRGWSFSYPH